MNGTKHNQSITQPQHLNLKFIWKGWEKKGTIEEKEKKGTI